MEWFRNRIEAKIVVEDWRQHNNEVRPHSSFGYLIPLEWVGNWKTGYQPKPNFNWP